jgi:hypothetical protein
MDALSASTIDPGRILIDHVEEHTVADVLDRGFWAGMTLYPDTKMTPQRATDVIEMYGSERIWMNSAGDWGCSDPLAVPKVAAGNAAAGPFRAADRSSHSGQSAYISESVAKISTGCGVCAMSRPAGSVRYDNSGRVVLVTGGASGIGRSICEHWQQSGATVVCLDVDEQSRRPCRPVSCSCGATRQSGLTVNEPCRLRLSGVVDWTY